MGFWVLNPRCNDAERSVRARISVDTLSERPNVRVRADPACVRFAREAEGRVAGALSLVRFFGASKEMNKGRILKNIFCTLSLAAKKGYPQESRPCVSRPAGVLAKHLFTAASRTRTSGRSDSLPLGTRDQTLCSAAPRWGLKVKTRI